jgi:hypothetical protein
MNEVVQGPLVILNLRYTVGIYFPTKDAIRDCFYQLATS